LVQFKSKVRPVDNVEVGVLMTTNSLLVRCFAVQDGDQWVAMCIDLSLAAQGSTYEESRAKLHAQIHDYVREALVEDSRHGAQLLRRKSPLSIRARYHWNACRSKLLDTFGRACSVPRSFTDTLPLMPQA